MTMSFAGNVWIVVCFCGGAYASNLHTKADSAHSADLKFLQKLDKLPSWDQQARFPSLGSGNVLSGWAEAAHDAEDDDDDDDDDDDEDVSAVTAPSGKPKAMPIALHVEPETKAVSKPSGLSKPAEPKPESKPEAKPESKPEAKQELKPESKVESKQEPKPDSKPEPKLESAKADTNVTEDDDDEDDEEAEDTRDALEAAKQKMQAAQGKVEDFDDEEAYDDKISEEVKLIANETQSPTLSSFLGELRHEMRSYAKPSYPSYLEARADAAEKRVKELEKELEKESGKKGEKDNSEGTPEAKALVKEASSISVKEVERKAGETWAVSFFATITMLTAVFAMASSKNDSLKNYTWFVIDQVIVIFLAVMYFQAFDSLLDFGAMGVHNEVVASILHAVIMLSMILVIAARIRKNELGLAVLCGAGAHVASFSSIHAAAGLQNYFVGMSMTSLTCIFGLFVLALGLAVVGYLVLTAKKKAQLDGNQTFMEKTDDLENDFGAMAFSVVFTMFVRYLLTGHHPVDDETDFDHSSEQRMRMFIYAWVCLLVAGFTVTLCSKKAAESDSYAFKRMMTFCNTVATMNVAWAFLYWGEWQFFEALYPGEAIKGRVMFAIVATVACGLVLFALTKITSLQGEAKKNKLVALTAISLVCAWSWELCFDAAVEDMTEGVSHPAGWKIGLTLFLFAVILPVYAMYVKPITGPAAEAIA